MDIKNKVIVITGASEGIGAAAAGVLIREGGMVVLAARSEDKLAVLAHELNGADIHGDNDAARAIAIKTDMRNPDDIKKLIDLAMATYGRIDVFINNAGQGMYGPVESIDIEKYREIMELNVYAPLRAMQLVIPIMRKQGGGMILNISSRVSKNYFPNLGAYASTKYALNAISLTARTELSKDNIVVSVMHPKLTSTSFGKNAFGGHPDYSSPSAQSSSPNSRTNTLPVDTPEAVAERMAELIRSEAPEAEM
jgi:short-subunit dehydrogenase